MSFTFPHLHSNKFSGLFNYKLGFQLGKPEGFCFGQRTERADPIRGLGGRRKGVPGSPRPSSLPSPLPVALPPQLSQTSFPCPWLLSVADVPTTGI